MEEIDVVIPWVDGGDPVWQDTLRRYTPNPDVCDANFERYRDWDLLKYWFRGIERFAPWVRKVHFITCGQTPEWLNTANPKLNLVNHSDYIDEEYLPVFSSHPIELPIHKINGLSDKFIYFNDDFFLIDNVIESDFFTKGLPNDAAIMNTISGRFPMMLHIAVNNQEIINRNFTKYQVIKNSISKWFSPKYKLGIYRNLALLAWPNFTGFLDFHLPQAYLKSTLETVWEKEDVGLRKSLASKFRSISDVNMYLFRYWQLCSGKFHPKDVSKLGCYFDVINEQNVDEIAAVVKNGRSKVIVINDGDVQNFDLVKARLNSSFEQRLPNKSNFEK